MTFLRPERSWIVAAIVLVVACVRAGGRAGAAPRLLYAATPPTPFMPCVAEHGMVVAQEKIAAHIGADVLRRGGNAVDAAVATGFAMAVTYPRAGNIGGGGFMVIHSAEHHEDVAVDIARPRRRDHAAMFLGPTASPIRRSRAISRSASAFPARCRTDAGAGEIRLGQIPAGRIAAAGDRTGARWLSRGRRHRRYAAGLASAAGALARSAENLFPRRWHLAARRRYAGSDRSRGNAFCHRRTGSARILRGPVAEKLVKATRDAGGIMTADDLKSYQAVIRAPMRGTIAAMTSSRCRSPRPAAWCCWRP